MKLLILSDSHGNPEPMVLAVEREQPQTIVHLGDYWRDGEALARRFPGIALYQVAGNCDSYDRRPDSTEKRLCRFQGVTFYLTHGHREQVKFSLLRLRLAAQEAGAQVALFGHTHCAFGEEVDGLLMLNPGTCGGLSGSYGVMELTEAGMRWEIRTFRKLLKGEYV